MIIRIVRMTFREDALGAFESLFDASAGAIRAFPGCRRLELWTDVDEPAVRSTYSIWDSEDALESYRASELFRSTWSRARALFAAPPVATSHEVIRSVVPGA